MPHSTIETLLRRERPRAHAAPPAAALLLVAAVIACGGGGAAVLGDRPVLVEASGAADDGSPATPPVAYPSEDDGLWAADSLTTAFSDPATATRLAGGVTAQPVDTVVRAGVGALAEATSRNRLVTPLVVERGGRFSFALDLELRDVELGNDGRAAVGLRGHVLDASGARLPGGEIGTITLQVRADGSVIVDGLEEEPEYLEPNFGFSRSTTGPRGGVELRAGDHMVELELFLQATAPVAAGGHQFATVGQAVGRVRLR